MIIKIRKREGEKNGRLSIINRKSVKMDFPENKNKSDNDIFKTTERILSTKHDKRNLVSRIDQYIKENSLYVNGKKNLNFKKQYNSQIFIGDTLKPHDKHTITQNSINLKDEKNKKDIRVKTKSRNIGEGEFRANSTMMNNTQFIEVFGSINKNNYLDENVSKFNVSPNKKFNFTEMTVNNSNTVKNFFEGSIENPLRTCLFDQEKKIVNVKTLLTSEDIYNKFHSKMQDKKYSTIKEKIKEREKLTLSISKSFVDQKEKSKQNYLKKIETQSFYDESRDHVYSRAKMKNNNFESGKFKFKREFSLIDSKSKRIDQYYSKYVDNYEPRINLEKFISLDNSKFFDFKDTLGKIVEKNEKSPSTKKIDFNKNEILKSKNVQQIKEDLLKTNYYMNEIKKLKDREKVLKNMLEKTNKPKEAKNSCGSIKQKVLLRLLIKTKSIGNQNFKLKVKN